eukprot:64923_1
MRIKIVVLPQKEKLCVITQPNSSINELQQLTYTTLMKYPVYQILLVSCNLILELRTNNEDYAISGSYLVREVLRDKNDIIVAKFVSKSNNTFHKLQPQQIDPFITSQSVMKTMGNKIQTTTNNQIHSHQNIINEQKTETEQKTIVTNMIELNTKEHNKLLQDFENSTIFDLMSKYSNEMKGNDEKDNIIINFDEHKSLLIKLQTFCMHWFQKQSDTQQLSLDELSQVLYSLFPTDINYLKSLYQTTSIHSWQQQLFIELRIQQNIDPHITLTIDINKNCYQFKWNNYWVFDAQNTKKLMNAVKDMFITDINTWNKYGFGLLSNEYFEQTKQDWYDQNIKTIYDQNIVKLPGWNHLIIDLRNSKLMIFAWNSKPESIKLVETNSFKNSVTIQTDHGYEINIDKWRRFCLDRKILPITLLKYWISESKQKFMTKKEFNKCIKIIGNIPSKNMSEWIKQKNEYYLQLELNSDIEKEKYILYLESCAVNKKYIEKYKKKLNQKLCDQMIELFLNDSVQGFNSEAADIKIAELFEKHIVDKLRLIVSCVNNTVCNNNIGRIKLLDQQEQQSFWAFLRNKYLYGGTKEQRITPDVLLNEPIIINNNKIHWIDAKHWFIAQSSKILFKRFIQSVTKYTKAYGPGAIICNGFEENVDQYQTIKQFNVTLLDGSRDLSVYQ